MDAQRFDVDRLLADRRWIHGLARRLCGNDDWADEVVQDTYLAAIRNPPRESGAWRAWLRTTTLNAARQLLRREGTRGRHERAASLAEAAMIDDSGERLRLQRRLLEAVDALGDPYRTAVILRYFEGLDGSAIAARLGIPASTVRTHLSRGLDEVRRRLDKEYGDRRAWSAVLLPLAAGFGKSVGGAGGAAAVTAAGGIGLMSLTSKALFTLGVLLVLGGYAIYRLASEEEQPRRETIDQVIAAREREPRRVGADGNAAPAAAQAVPQPGASVSAEPAAPTSASTATARAGSFVIVGRVLDEAAKPVALADVRLAGLAKDLDDKIERLTATAGADGGFTVDATDYLGKYASIVEFETLVDHPEFLEGKTRVHVGEAKSAADGSRRLAVEVTLHRAAFVGGRVLGEDGQLADGIAVAAFPLESNSADRHRPFDEVLTDARGDYRLRAAAGIDLIVVATKADARPDWKSGRAAHGAPLVLPDLVLKPGLEVAGRILVGGVPRKVAVVTASLVEPGRRLAMASEDLRWLGDRVARGRVRAWSALPEDRVEPAELGAFIVPGLSDSEYRVEVDEIEDLNVHMSLSDHMAKTVRPPAAACDFDIRGVPLLIRARKGSAPATDASVDVMTSGVFSLTVDAAGEARILVAPDVDHDIAVSAAGFETWNRKLRFADQNREEIVEAVLLPKAPGATLDVVVVGPGGESIGEAGFGLFKIADDFSFPEHQFDARAVDGRFKIEDVPPGRWRLRVRAGAAWDSVKEYFCEAETNVDIHAAAANAANLVVHRGGRLRIAVRDPENRHLNVGLRLMTAAGSPVAVNFLARATGGGSSSSPVELQTPGEVESVLEPGAYRLEITCKGFEATTAAVDIRPGETAVVDVVLKRR